MNDLTLFLIRMGVVLGGGSLLLVTVVIALISSDWLERMRGLGERYKGR